MSLLREALKRKEIDEAQRKAGPESTRNAASALPRDDANLTVKRQEADARNAIIPEPPPSQSMPVPVPPQADVSQPARRSLGAGGSIGRKTSFFWGKVAVVVVLSGLMAASGVVFFIQRWQARVKSKVAQQASQIGKTDTMTADSAEKKAHQFAVPDAEDVEKEPVVAAAWPQTAAVMQEAATKPLSTKPSPVMTEAPGAPSPDVRWPTLKLTGILRGSGPTESTALINGRMISTGQTIDNVVVVEIQADGVLLKYGAEERLLRVGAVLY